MDINVNDTKIELIKWLTTLEDKSILKQLLELRKTAYDGSAYELSEAEIKSIEAGLEDIKKGRVVSQSEAQKVYEKWL